jgi:hypothetical protein
MDAEASSRAAKVPVVGSKRRGNELALELLTGLFQGQSPVHELVDDLVKASV